MARSLCRMTDSQWFPRNDNESSLNRVESAERSYRRRMESIAHVEAVIPIGCTVSQITKIQREIKEVNPVEVPPRERPLFWNRSKQKDEPLSAEPAVAATATAAKPPQPATTSVTPRLSRAAQRDTSLYADTPDSLDVSTSMHSIANTAGRPSRLLRADESSMQLDTPM